MTTIIVSAVCILAGIMLSAMFSGLETGLYTLNRVRLAVRASHGDRAAQRIRSILASPTRMLAMILIGNNIANYTASYGIAALLDRGGYAPAEAVAINAALLIPLLFVFGEILPKDLFRTHTDHWTYRCTGFLVTVRAILTWTGLLPAVSAFGAAASRLLGGPPAADLSARQRMSRLIKEGMGAGVLTETQTTLADRAMLLRERTVRDEMVPWARVVTIPADASRAERVALIRQRNFTRYPVIERDGSVAGVLSLLDVLLEPDRPVRELMSPALRLSAGMAVRPALRTMREQRTPIALVNDQRSGAVIGLVTLKDLVEPLTGDLPVW